MPLPAAESSHYSSSVYRDLLDRMGVVLAYTHGVSMRPLIWTGHHYVAITPINDAPKIGDILLFEQMRNGKTVCVLHRLIDIKNDVYITRGDNCLGCEYVHRKDIIGRVTDIYLSGKPKIYFAIKSKHISTNDSTYKRYVRTWSRIWWLRKEYYLLRCFAAKVYRLIIPRKG